MTKPARNRIILKDVNDNISDHLRNHMHLTNCIHLKNHHMRSKQSPILAAANRSLMRDLAVLQRSTRSLRDPSTSPPQVRFGTSADENRLQDDFKDFIHGNGYGNSTHRSINVKNRRRRRKCDTTLDGSELSVASNSFGQCQNQDVSKNRCGIPWNWSRIHRSGKSFLDLAGKNLYCGFSESTRSRIHADFSGELGIFAGNNLLNDDTDSELVSEARFCGKCCSLGHNGNSFRHWSLTNKYMPLTFRGLVGQNLVVKALSNAIHKRKVGSLYAFYGPSGTGKTCCARIFSRALNCKSRDHHSKPCGACSSCINNLNVREIGPVSNVDFEDIMDLLEMMSVSQYRVFIFDGCDNLATRSWNAILKFIDRAPRKVVFVLICSRLDELPHMIISRCQKFFFPKLRDVDMIRTLRRIAAEEEVEIDEDALKLVATRAYGSLRDGEMTLEQLSLLGQRVTVSLVQELVGLISDEKLVDLLDLALSADTINTVRNLRGIIKAGVEPLALMSQLATVITDILAGSYDFSKDRSQRRKFFRRHALTKDDLEKLRQALKTLSEAEKQLRVSNDRVTWLTAALLQLAPDQQDQLLISSADTSFNQSPLGLFNYGGETELLKTENVQTGSSMSNYNDGTEKRGIIERKQHSIADIWMDVIKRINVTSLKEFLYQEGRLVLVRFGAAPKVRLVFRSHVSRSKAEKFRVHISQAFESVLGSSPVMLEIRDESRKDLKAGLTVFPTSRGGSSSHIQTSFSRHTRFQKERVGALPGDFYSSGTAENEIVELESTPSRVAKQLEVRQLGNIEQKNMSLVRGKVSLAQVLQLAEGCAQQPQSIWSHRMAVSVAEKLEHDNLRLEPRYRSLFCWKSRRVSCPKLKRLRTRSRRPKALLKLVSCGKCLSGRSSR